MSLLFLSGLDLVKTEHILMIYDVILVPPIIRFSCIVFLWTNSWKCWQWSRLKSISRQWHDGDQVKEWLQEADLQIELDGLGAKNIGRSPFLVATQKKQDAFAMLAFKCRMFHHSPCYLCVNVIKCVINMHVHLISAQGYVVFLEIAKLLTGSFFISWRALKSPYRMCLRKAVPIFLKVGHTAILCIYVYFLYMYIICTYR